MQIAFWFAAVTAMAFVLFGMAFLREGLSAPTLRVRGLALLAAGLSLQFAVGAGWAAGVEAEQIGWIPEATGAFVRDWLGLGVEILALGVGIVAVRMVYRADTALHQAERMTAILSSRLPNIGRLSDIGLTPREWEVVELIATGVGSDRELSSALSISPSTAATHVRNIMQKARVHDRHDLLLLSGGTAGEGEE